MRTPDINPNPRPVTGVIVPSATPPGSAREGSAAASAEQFPSMGQLLQGLRRCWLRALTFGVLCGAGLAAAAWFTLPMFSKTRVRVLLMVEPEQPHNVFNHGESMAANLSFKKTQAALVKSRVVLNAALRQPKVANLKTVKTVQKEQFDPVEWLEQNLIVDYSAGPDILTISMSGDNDADLKEITAAVMNAYLEEFVSKQNQRRVTQGDKLAEIKNKCEDALRDKRKTLQDVLDAATKSDAGDLVLKQQKALAQLGATQQELGKVRSDVLRLKAMVTDQDGAIPDNILNEQVDKDGRVQELLQAITQLETEVEQIRRNTTPARFPTLSQKTRDQIGALQKDLEARRSKVHPIMEDQLRNQNKARVEERKAQLTALERLEKALDDEVDRLATESPRSINKRGQDLVQSLREEIDQREDILRRVFTQLEIYNVEKGAPSRVWALEPEPIVTHQDVRKRQLSGAAGGGLGGFALVVFGLAWWDCRSRRVNSADEVVRGIGLKLLGTLPMVPARTRQRAALAWQNLLLESVDAIRTMLLHVAHTDSLRVVMVTSAVGGEGKTSLSSHVATSLARAGRKTLLIDCDLRKPSLQRVFTLPEEAGFCELLRGEAELADVIQPTQIPGLSVIAAGLCDATALGRLADGGPAAILAQLRPEYDFVIVDTSPVLPVTDALVIAQEVDGVIFSVLRDVSRMNRLNIAYERMAFLGVRILGAVVTGTPKAELYGRDYQYLGYAMGTEKPEESPAGEES
jgi:succinoglycan biosynthesis transport protein ExoP